jgi:AcrR family transcriptional regulator
VICVTSPSIGIATDTSEAAVPREERRRRTEAAILEAARELFADVGFEKTTIRSVAAKAGIDPALVMQYYGNKEGLFAASARWHVDHKRMIDATLGEIPQTALDDVLAAFEAPATRDATVALFRNCLTHDSALEIVRDEVLCENQATVAKTIGGDDADLRAGLLAATLMGLTLARYLLRIPAVESASREDLERVLLPVLTALVSPATS